MSLLATYPTLNVLRTQKKSDTLKVFQEEILFIVIVINSYDRLLESCENELAWGILHISNADGSKV